MHCPPPPLNLQTMHGISLVPRWPPPDLHFLLGNTAYYRRLLRWIKNGNRTLSPPSGLDLKTPRSILLTRSHLHNYLPYSFLFIYSGPDLKTLQSTPMVSQCYCVWYWCRFPQIPALVYSFKLHSVWDPSPWVSSQLLPTAHFPSTVMISLSWSPCSYQISKL